MAGKKIKKLFVKPQHTRKMMDKLTAKAHDAIKPLCQTYHLSLLLVFGSMAQGTDQEYSDIDIAVLPEKITQSVDKLALLMEMEQIFHKTVDLVVLSPTTDPLLLYEIYTNSRPLFQGKEGLFIQQYVRALNIYWDTQRLRQMDQVYLDSFHAR